MDEENIIEEESSEDINTEEEYRLNEQENEFIQTVIDLREAYLNNNLPEVMRLVDIINHNVCTFGLERSIYEILSLPRTIEEQITINESLFYIIQHLNNLYQRDEFYLTLRVRDITERNLFNLKNAQKELKVLFNDYIKNKQKFFNLSPMAKLVILSNCIKYSLNEELLSMQGLLNKDKIFSSRE